MDMKRTTIVNADERSVVRSNFWQIYMVEKR